MAESVTQIQAKFLLPCTSMHTTLVIRWCIPPCKCNILIKKLMIALLFLVAL